MGVVVAPCSPADPTEQVFELPWGFPTLNDLLRETSHHWSNRSKSKRKWQTIIIAEIKRARIKKYAGPVGITISYYPPNRKRDPDNAAAVVRKYVLDALQQSQVIEQDNWSGIDYLRDNFCDPIKDDPKIKVNIKGTLKQ